MDMPLDNCCASWFVKCMHRYASQQQQPCLQRRSVGSQRVAMSLGAQSLPKTGSSSKLGMPCGECPQGMHVVRASPRERKHRLACARESKHSAGLGQVRISCPRQTRGRNPLGPRRAGYVVGLQRSVHKKKSIMAIPYQASQADVAAAAAAAAAAHRFSPNRWPQGLYLEDVQEGETSNHSQ
jgi:hypothetical protein